MAYAYIAGTGGYLPERIIKNSDLEKLVATSDQWILERTGISTRHIMAKDETTSSMAEKAALKALAAAGIAKDDIGLIIVATTTAEYVFPSTACVLQQRLQITNSCPAFDINAACAGFIYALSIADQYLRAGAINYALVVGVDALSQLLDWKDRNTCVLFSDGAGAVVLQASDKPGIIGTHLHADGRYKDLLYAANQLGELKEPSYIKMRGNEVFKMAVSALEAVVDETLTKNGITKEQIAWLVPHQANLRIIKATAQKLGLTLDRVILTIKDHGNTSSASIPLALHQGISDGRIKRQDLLLLEGFGAGFAWGSALIIF